MNRFASGHVARGSEVWRRRGYYRGSVVAVLGGGCGRLTPPLMVRHEWSGILRMSWQRFTEFLRPLLKEHGRDWTGLAFTFDAGVKS
jgi:hypothetical protein